MVRESSVASVPSGVAGVVLASGLSSRFGSANKLLSPYRGVPIVRRTVAAYLDAHLRPVVVVLGHDANAVEEALAGLPVETVHNPDFAAGQSRALVCGLRALPESAEAAVIGVGDQPELTAAVIELLLTAQRREGAILVAPRYGDAPGNPVLFTRELFPELLEVQGDVGGRPVLQRHQAEVRWVPVEDPRFGADVDTPEELRRLLGE